MEVDINGDGTIDFEEFLGMMKSKANEADQESDLREAFKIFDRDKDGFIDLKELKSVSSCYIVSCILKLGSLCRWPPCWAPCPEGRLLT